MSGGALLLLAALYYLDGQGVLPLALGACALHEGGHWLAIRALGGRVAALRITCVGAEMRLSARLPLGYGAQIIAALARQKSLASKSPAEGFAPVQADFDQMVRDLKARAKAAGDRLENLFAFCDEVFPEGQELLILVTELTVSYYAAAFIGRHGCPAYFAHNRELLFYERQQEIITHLENLELD